MAKPEPESVLIDVDGRTYDITDVKASRSGEDGPVLVELTLADGVRMEFGGEAAMKVFRAGMEAFDAAKGRSAGRPPTRPSPGKPTSTGASWPRRGRWTGSR